VDHIDNNPLNNHIDNLQLITQRENVIKEREASTKEIPCKLDRPLSYYEDKLAYYEDLYQKAVEEGNQEEAHNQRGNTYTQRAKIRYWLSHKEEATKAILEKEAKQAFICSERQKCHERAEEYKTHKRIIDKRRNDYKKAVEYYGPNDWETIKFKSEWKLAVLEFNKWKENNPKIKISKK
jgi:uncharacterized protein (DUF3084 family)